MDIRRDVRRRKMIYLSDQTGWKQTQCKVTMGDDAGIASTYHFRIRNLGGGVIHFQFRCGKRKKKCPEKRGQVWETERLAASAEGKLGASASPSRTEQICFCSVHVFTQGWQTHSPHAHRCYSRKLCKSDVTEEKSLAHKPFQRSDPSHYMLLCSFLSRFSPSLRLLSVDLYPSQPMNQISAKWGHTHLTGISPFHRLASVLQQRWNIWQEALIACLVSAAARSTINLERLFLCLRGFLQMCAGPDVKRPNEAYPNFHSPPI